MKGSPEAISSLCVQSTIPADFAPVLSGFTHQGYRVIAYAYKELTEPLPHVEKAEQRLLVEKELTFMGLLLLENAVKPETKPTLTILNRAKIRTVMVTGDNPLTAVAVAKECGLVLPGTCIFQSQLVKTMRGEELEWRDTDNPNSGPRPPHTEADVGDEVPSMGAGGDGAGLRSSAGDAVLLDPRVAVSPRSTGRAGVCTHAT